MSVPSFETGPSAPAFAAGDLCVFRGTSSPLRTGWFPWPVIDVQDNPNNWLFGDYSVCPIGFTVPEAFALLACQNLKIKVNAGDPESVDLRAQSIWQFALGPAADGLPSQWVQDDISFDGTNGDLGLFNVGEAGTAAAAGNVPNLQAAYYYNGAIYLPLLVAWNDGGSNSLGSFDTEESTHTDPGITGSGTLTVLGKTAPLFGIGTVDITISPGDPFTA